jgi:hypothetical protein
MLKDVIKVSLLQKGQNNRIKNIVSVFYGIQNPPETLQELRDAHLHEWNNTPQAFIQRLIGFMRRRCEAVVAARDCHVERRDQSFAFSERAEQ